MTSICFTSKVLIPPRAAPGFVRSRREYSREAEVIQRRRSSSSARVRPDTHTTYFTFQSKNSLTRDARRTGGSVQSRSCPAFPGVRLLGQGYVDADVSRDASLWSLLLLHSLPVSRELLAHPRHSATPAVHAPPNNLSYFARLLGTRSQRAAEVRNSRLLGES